MIAAVVNMAAVLVCSIIGLAIKVPEKFQKAIMNALALAVFFIGVSGSMKGLLHDNSNVLLFVISLVIGTIVGEAVDFENKCGRLGAFLGNKFGGGAVFAKGFVTSSFIFCIGAMAIVGSFESGLTGNHTIIYTKSIIDGATSIILASTLGVGVAFSAFAILIYQGAWTLTASFMAPLITDDSIRELSVIGNVLIAAIALDILEIKKIKYANMLPAMFIPIIYYFPLVQSIITSIIPKF